MPLHLLGKKSWNVYNPAAIERVRRDEAEAQRQAEEREKKALQDEADERVRLLRGGGAPSTTTTTTTIPPGQHSSDGSESAKTIQSQDSALRPAAHRIKTRRLAGEDDTDRDIRVARETQQLATTTPEGSLPLKRQRPDIDEDSIVDASGNISLIPVQKIQSEAESVRKKAKIEDDPYTVYLSHAAGKDKDLATNRPWYYEGNTTGNDGLERAKSKWGDDSDRKRERESARMASQDPLAMMKRGVRQLREAEKQRQKWMEQRERDLREVEEMAVVAGARRRNIDDASHDRRHRRRKRRDGDSHGGRYAESGRRRRSTTAATGIEVKIEIDTKTPMDTEMMKADIWRTTVAIVAMTVMTAIDMDMVIVTVLSVTIVLNITIAIVGGALIREVFIDNLT